MSRTIHILHTLSVLCIGLFAGQMYTYLFITDGMLDKLDGPTYTAIMQDLVRYSIFPALVPPLVTIPIIALSINLVLLRRSRAFFFWLTVAGFLVYLAGAYLTTMFINLPINLALLNWSIQNPPADWFETRAYWHQVNYIRTLSLVISFTLLTAAPFYSLQVVRNPSP